MKFSYQFSNLLGTVYRSGDIIFTKDGNTLICPVGNKISVYDLANNRSITLPIESRLDYNSLALSPDGNILIAAQEDGEIHIINIGFKSIIYRKRLNGRIENLKFSPNGKYFALSKNKTVFVYNSPSCSRRVYDPFSLEKVFDSAYDDILCLDWSPDSRLLSFGSRDMSVHVCGVTKFENLRDYFIVGNTDSVMGVFFESKSYDVCTVSEGGAVSVWTCSAGEDDLIPAQSQSGVEVAREESPEEEEEEEQEEEEQEQEEQEEEEEEGGVRQPLSFHQDKKEIKEKGKGTVYYKRKSKLYLRNFLKGPKSDVTSASYMKANKMLVAAFDSGDFLLVDMTGSGALIHSLNISQKAISSTCISASGDWIALGVASRGELLVWEWQSETHVLKQQGHFNSMRVVSYSPDGLYLATGGEDGKLKLWSTESSFCFVTFSEHTSAITGVAFTQSGKAILSSSLDGTVRAFDMTRYRNFKTLTSPKPCQFSCLSVDSSGDLVVAGGQDNHEIFLWSLQTGKLLEILGGHCGPVVSVHFSPELGSTKLLSTAWDKSVKVWDAIANTTAKETIPLLSDGMCVSMRMEGGQFAVATMDGHITVFNGTTFRQEGNIEGRNDLGAGREDQDKVAAKSNLKAKCFTTLSYSPDGKYIIAAGQSKNVCIYSVEDELLIKKFEVTQNRSLSAMDKLISRRKMAEGGLNIADVEERGEEKAAMRIPGSVHGAATQRTFRPQVSVSCLAFSRTGRSWAACTTEGLLAYSLDDAWLFDPTRHLEESNTPAAARRALRDAEYSSALMMAVRLNLKPLIREVLESTPLESARLVVGALTPPYVEALIALLPALVETSRHLGFYAAFAAALLSAHGHRVKARAPGLVSELSALQKAFTNHHDNLSKVCNHNEYMLSYLLCQADLKRRRGNNHNRKDAMNSDLSSSDEEQKEVCNS